MFSEHIKYEHSKFNHTASCYPTSLATAIALNENRPPYETLDEIVGLIETNFHNLSFDLDHTFGLIFLRDPEHDYFYVNIRDVHYDFFSMRDAGRKMTQIFSPITSLKFEFVRFKNASDIFQTIQKDGITEISLGTEEKGIGHSAILRVDSHNPNLVVYHDPLNETPFVIDTDFFLRWKKIRPIHPGIQNIAENYYLEYIGTRIIRP